MDKTHKHVRDSDHMNNSCEFEEERMKTDAFKALLILREQVNPL